MTTDPRSDAFTQLVHQHAGMVYSAARRQVHDPALADDITQAVFLLLWQKLPTIRRHSLLAAWLLRATFYASRRAVTMRSRRASHERKAAAMRSESSPPTADDLWTNIAPHLDSAMQKLPDADRAAIALHYLQNMTFVDVGQHLGISEEAARKRVDRALPKLHRLLAAPASAPLGLALAAHALTPVPAALLSSLLATPTATVALSIAALAKSVSASLAFAKAKLIATLVCLTTVTGAVTIAAEQLAKPPAPPAPAPVTFVTTAPSTQLSADGLAVLIYSAGLEAPVADDIRSLSTVVRSKDNYQLLIADAERVRQVLLREYLAGNVMVSQNATRRGFASMSGGSFTDADNVGWLAFGDTDAHWYVTQGINLYAGTKATVDAQGRLHIGGGMCSVNLGARDPAWAGAESHINQAITFDPVISPGQVALVLHDLAQVGKAHRYSLIAFCPTPASVSEAAGLAELSNTDTCLRLRADDLRRLSQAVRDYQTSTTPPAAPQPSSKKWTKTLTDGTTIRLMAIGMPNRWPLLMWDPDGNPLNQPGRWPIAPPDITSPQIVYEVTSPFATGDGGNRTTLPDGSTRHVDRNSATYGGPSYSYSTRELREFSVRMGVGPWQSAGVVSANQTVSAPGLKVQIGEVTRFANNADQFWFTLPAPTDKAVTFALADDRDNRRSHSSSTAAIQAGPGKQAILLDYPRSNWIAHVSTDSTSIPNAKYELLYRNVEVITFSDFALQPRTLPPFDLQAKDGARANPQPTRVATSQPADIPQLRERPSRFP